VRRRATIGPATAWCSPPSSARGRPAKHLANSADRRAEGRHVGSRRAHPAAQRGGASLESGVHIKAVADLLGHSSVAVTGDVYGHTSDSTARAAVDSLADDSVCWTSKAALLSEPILTRKRRLRIPPKPPLNCSSGWADRICTSDHLTLQSDRSRIWLSRNDSRTDLTSTNHLKASPANSPGSHLIVTTSSGGHVMSGR
jgi:hypothetical protein